MRKHWPDRMARALTGDGQKRPHGETVGLRGAPLKGRRGARVGQKLVKQSIVKQRVGAGRIRGTPRVKLLGGGKEKGEPPGPAWEISAKPGHLMPRGLAVERGLRLPPPGHDDGFAQMVKRVSVQIQHGGGT